MSFPEIIGFCLLALGSGLWAVSVLISRLFHISASSILQIMFAAGLVLASAGLIIFATPTLFVLHLVVLACAAALVVFIVIKLS